MQTLLSPLPFLNLRRVVDACAIMFPPIGLLVSLAKLMPVCQGRGQEERARGEGKGEVKGRVERRGEGRGTGISGRGISGRGIKGRGLSGNKRRREKGGRTEIRG